MGESDVIQIKPLINAQSQAVISTRKEYTGFENL